MYKVIKKFNCCGKTMVTIIIEDKAACVMSELEYNRIIETERKYFQRNNRRSIMVVRGEIQGVLPYNGWHYGYKQLKRGIKYYRSKNVRFDDSCGGTEECSEEEYHKAAKEYGKIFR